MKAIKKEGVLKPVNMTQPEMDELKRGNPEIINILHKRIVAASKRNKSSVKNKGQKKFSPVKLSRAQLEAIKKTGKVPKALGLEIARDRKYERPDSRAKNKDEKFKKPSFTPQDINTKSQKFI